MPLARDNWDGHDLTTPAQRQWYGSAAQPVEPPTLAQQIAECEEQIASLQRAQERGVRMPMIDMLIAKWRARLAELVEPARQAAE